METVSTESNLLSNNIVLFVARNKSLAHIEVLQGEFSHLD